MLFFIFIIFKEFSLEFFFEFLISKLLIFSTLELYLLSYSIRIIYLWEKKLFKVVETSKCL